jgi:hypothetical protein
MHPAIASANTGDARNVAIGVLTWTAVGFDYYNRHYPSDLRELKRAKVNLFVDDLN